MRAGQYRIAKAIIRHWEEEMTEKENVLDRLTDIQQEMERAKANLPVQEIDCPHCSSKVTVYETVNLGDRRLFEGRCATCGRNVTSYREAR